MRHSGLSVTGSGHAKTGTPCQDAQAILDTADLLVLAVADGAGSARHAELAAQQATACALAWFQAGRPLPTGPAAWEAELRTLLEHLPAELAAEARRLDCPPRELACTFLLTLITADALVGVQVGDGAIAYRPMPGEGDLALLTAPQQGEYLNETVFLISDTCLQDAQFAYRDGAPDAITLFSDGLQMLALNMTGRPPLPHAPFFDPLFNFIRRQPDAGRHAEQLSAFLESERVCAKTDDDKILVIAVRTDPPA
ncbi:PP2C family serine/threonine-protein phosphatase [uncultured Thiodictyon sp.]|uniref:PP2C family serine/threonine-protein phosphatase n=1 Tax=uncultured Thiodictyon sp. TaxID=1846217 RepID=UPI0025F645A3|nr:PP2C family serine/threonine-protein phosphatase [uncultured Thiodictyon sp.]